MMLVAGYASTVAIAAAWLALTILIVAWVVHVPHFHGVRRLPVRLRVDGDGWTVVYSDGQRRAIALRRPTGRLGRWWFIHWAGGWVVITQRSIGTQAWRSLTARLKDAGRPAALRGASRTG